MTGSAAGGGPRATVAVVGPTAAGKSDLAVDLALALGADVVNADSMQLYRGMDIGTAKLPVEARRGVRHHLLDVWEVHESASVAAYQRMARASLSGNRPAVLVGGSGLYVRAALDDLAFPGTDPEVRAGLEAELDAAGPAVLHRRLAEHDPAAARSISVTNGRRIVRALEVVTITGRPFLAVLPPPRYCTPAVQIGLDLPRDELDRRIGERVEAMWAAGLVDEVRALLPMGLRAGRTARRALGYAQVLRVLDGEWSPEQARAETVRATRRFARRQDSWFRRDARIAWLPAGVPDLLERALAAIVEHRRLLESTS